MKHTNKPMHPQKFGGQPWVGKPMTTLRYFTVMHDQSQEAMSPRHVPAKALWFCAAIMVLWTAWAYRDALATWWW